jgi:hypothetical protein
MVPATANTTPDFVKLGTKARKLAVALVGVIAQVIQLNLVPEKYEGWALGIVAFLTAVGVYVVPNEDTRV